MMNEDLLRQAIQAARDGQNQSARNMFIDVVRMDPSSEVAWMWLSGLLELLEDQIVACEKVLSINPNNKKIRVYLDELLEKQAASHQNRLSEIEGQVEQVCRFIEEGQRDEALLLLQKILQEEDGNESTWLLYADLSANINDKVRAYEAIVQINPSNQSAHKNLKHYRYYQQNPLELAAHYEEIGETEKAIELYHVLVAEAGDSSEFERIYKNIVRLENVKNENVQHVRPSLTILRLSAGIPLLYLLEIFIQEGLNPIKNPAPSLWIGFPMVAIGSFLISVAGVPSRHVIWNKWFGEQGGRGTSAARMLTSIAGWMMVAAPHLILLWDSAMRLQNFQPPTSPWIN